MQPVSLPVSVNVYSLRHLGTWIEFVAQETILYLIWGIYHLDHQDHIRNQGGFAVLYNLPLAWTFVTLQAFKLLPCNTFKWQLYTSLFKLLGFPLCFLLYELCGWSDTAGTNGWNIYGTKRVDCSSEGAVHSNWDLCGCFFPPHRWSHCVVSPWSGFSRKWKFNKRHYISEVKSWLQLHFPFGTRAILHKWIYSSSLSKNWCLRETCIS